jgi:hypothetical protein
MTTKAIKLAIVAAVAVAAGMFSPAALAATPKYATRRVPMGPRPDQYVLVRVSRETRSSAPYALTGRPEVRIVRRLIHRWAGPHYIGPVWVTERVSSY